MEAEGREEDMRAERREEDMRLTRASASVRAFESDWITSCMRSALCMCGTSLSRRPQHVPRAASLTTLALHTSFSREERGRGEV